MKQKRNKLIKLIVLITAITIIVINQSCDSGFITPIEIVHAPIRIVGEKKTDTLVSSSWCDLHEIGDTIIVAKHYDSEMYVDTTDILNRIEKNYKKAVIIGTGKGQP